MGNKTRIEWTDTTWNPVTGCSKVSQGCKNCYAERIFQRPYPGRDFTDVRMHLERLEQPLSWKRPRRIFVNSMSDLFHEKVQREFIKAVVSTIVDCPQHVFQILTKRPQRMRDFCLSCCPLPPNVWLGVSVEDQETADERIPVLLRTPAAVRFISYEPALGPVSLQSVGMPGCYGSVNALTGERICCSDHPDDSVWNEHLDWVIAGGESGPHARPAHPDWFRSVAEQCQASRVPFFFKQRGEWSWDDLGNTPTHVICKHGYWERIGLAFHCDEDECVKPGRIVQPIAKVGKQRAGRLLDGREWNEFPKVS